MEIKKYENGSTQIEKAMHSVSVRKADFQELKIVLAKAMAKAIADSGQKANDEDVDYLMKTIPSEILIQAPGIKLEEISIAINRGVYGEYGEYFGLNAVSFMFFIKKYMESAERINSAKEFQKSIEIQKPDPSEEEVRHQIKKAIIKAYQTFIEKGFYEDYGNFIYDKMDKIGLIDLNATRKHEIYKMAHMSISNKKSPHNALNRKEFKEFTSLIDNINNPDSIEGKDIIKKEAKKIALQIVFKEFLEIEIDIEELINQKENTE